MKQWTTNRKSAGRRLTAVFCVGAVLGVTGCSTPAAPGTQTAAASGTGATGVADTSGGVPGPFSTRPSEPFQPSAGATEDTGLPRRVASSMLEVSSPGNAALSAAMKQAVESRGMEYIETVTNSDAGKAVEQLTTVLGRGVGGAFIWDTDPEATAGVEQQLRDAGAATFSLSHGPGTTPMVAIQKELGQLLADSAGDYIRTELGGKAQVAIFNLDNAPAIRPAFQAVRDELTSIGPDVQIVSDVVDSPSDPTFGFNTMNSVLQAHPDVNVIIGLDSTMYSALSALEDAGKADPKVYIGGFGGDPRVGELISSGTSPYKASAAFNTSLWGYAAGQWSADWIEGKNVPQLCVIKPFLLDSKDAIEQLEADSNDPAGTYANKMSTYMQLLGTVSYADRTTIWNEKDPSNAPF